MNALVRLELLQAPQNRSAPARGIRPDPFHKLPAESLRASRHLGAGLTAEAGIAVFKIAFESWVNGTGQPDLPRIIRESLDELRAVTAGT